MKIMNKMGYKKRSILERDSREKDERILLAKLIAIPKINLLGGS